MTRSRRAKGCCGPFPSLILLGIALLAGIMPGLAPAARAAEARVAVAANFIGPAQELIALFQKAGADTVTPSFGASGRFVTQIENGAPYDVFLSADQIRPGALIADKLAVDGTAFTYAVGRLVFWSTDPAHPAGEQALRDWSSGKLAICNPDAAPYGRAALEALTALGLETTLRPHLVVGADVAQAFSFVSSGSAPAGFVALSQLHDRTDGSRWLVPQALYSPIRQDAVLLVHGAGNPAARAFLAFLKSAPAREVIVRYGYGTE